MSPLTRKLGCHTRIFCIVMSLVLASCAKGQLGIVNTESPATGPAGVPGSGGTCAAGSVGSGGTLAGVGMALKERDSRIKIALADPLGAALYSYYTTGELASTGSSITEGIGQGRVTANLEGAPVDFAYQITDEEALPIVFDLA